MPYCNCSIDKAFDALVLKIVDEFLIFMFIFDRKAFVTFVIG